MESEAVAPVVLINITADISPSTVLLSRLGTNWAVIGPWSWTFRIGASLVHADVIGPRPEDLATFLNDGMTTISGYVASFGYEAGLPLRATLRSVFIDGEALKSEVGWPAIAHLGNERQPGQQFDGAQLDLWVKASVISPPIRLALIDLCSALEIAQDTPMYSYRAIESCRQHFVEADDGQKRSPSWDRLHEHLGVSEADIRKVETLSTARRHGQDVYVSESDRKVALEVARRTVLRLRDLVLNEDITE